MLTYTRISAKIFETSHIHTTVSVEAAHDRKEGKTARIKVIRIQRFERSDNAGEPPSEIGSFIIPYPLRQSFINALMKTKEDAEALDDHIGLEVARLEKPEGAPHVEEE